MGKAKAKFGLGGIWVHDAEGFGITGVSNAKAKLELVGTCSAGRAGRALHLCSAGPVRSLRQAGCAPTPWCWASTTMRHRRTV